MSRLKISATALLVATLVSSPVAAAALHHPAKQAADAAGPVTSQLAPGVSLLIGQDGNVIFVTGPRGVLAIDDQRPRSVAAMMAAAAPAAITHAINTHWHLDHSGGNAGLAGAGAEIIAHATVRARLSTDQFMPAYNRTVPASPPIAWPTVLVDESLTLRHGEETIRLIHTPAAHTDGDLLVYLEQADVLHMGDLYFNGLYPFIDRGSGGTIDGLIAAIDVALAMSGEHTRVIPAHGDPTNRASLVAWRTMLATVRDRVVPQKAAGRTQDEVVAARLAADFELGGDADRFVAAIYDSLPPNASTTRP